MMNPATEGWSPPAVRRWSKITRQVLAALTLLLVCDRPGVAQDVIRPFTSDTLAAIRQELQGRGFILSLWSVTCAPCREDLAILSGLRERHPDLPIILVSTDAIGVRDDALWVLEQHGLQDLPSWMFADDFAEPLRFSIDPQWFGELPRSYFYAPDHSVTAHSGVLKPEFLEQNLEQLLRNGSGGEPRPAHAGHH